MEELLLRSGDRSFFSLGILGLLIVCDLFVNFPVTVLMHFNKKI